MVQRRDGKLKDEAKEREKLFWTSGRAGRWGGTLLRGRRGGQGKEMVQ